MKKTYFLDVLKEDEQIIKDNFPNSFISSESLNDKHNDAEILCASIHSKVSRKTINNFHNLKLIITRSVGYDHIDLEYANKKGITVCNIPDYGSHVIAEFVFALLLSGLRQIDRGDKRVEKNNFSFIGLKGISLKNKTLGIIGTGKIGINVARIASLGFLMNVLAYDPYPNKKGAKNYNFNYVDLKEIWKKSDIITLHCPLFPENKHLINKKTFSKMKEGIIIVNTSRGGLIDTNSLVEAIKSKKVSHAFLDVLEHEENIKESKTLIKLPNVITTPHIAFYADDSVKKMYELSFETIKKYLNGGELENKVIGI